MVTFSPNNPTPGNYFNIGQFYFQGKIYGWSQQDCDDGFLRKMKKICLASPTTAIPNLFVNTGM